MPLLIQTWPAEAQNNPDAPGKIKILFLEQQSWLSGAQKVLESVLDAVIPEFEPLVVFPDRGQFTKKLEGRNIATCFFPLGSYRSGRKSLFETLSFSARSVVCGMKLARLIRRRNVKLVYVNGPRCLPAGVIAACLTGRPVLFHLHSTLRRKQEIMLVAYLARYVARVVACSRATAQPLVGANLALDRQIQVLYNLALTMAGAVPSFKEVAEASGCITLGMVGRITESKGHLQLLNSVGKLSPEIQKQIRLVFVGAPSPGNVADLAYARRLKDCAQRLNLQSRITWAGYQADPRPFYESMDALIQPSSHEAGEGMPLAILEAFREGLPVIASRTGGIPEILQDGVNGLLFPPGDDAALAQALDGFLRDSKLRARLRAGSRATLTDRFSVENFQSEIRSLIQELVGSETPSKTQAAHGELAAWM